MKLTFLYAAVLTASLTSCEQAPTEHAQAAVSEYVQHGMSKTGNYRAEAFYIQPFTRQDSIAYVVKMNQRNEATAAVMAIADNAQAPTADFTRRTQERQQLLARQADTTRIALFVRHVYRNEDRDGTTNRDSVDAVVYPPREVVVLFTGQVQLQPGSRVKAK
jgi:membrane-bound lytic murein transglycosylase